MAKDKGPLQTAQREGDALKKEVDQFHGQCQNYLEDPSAGQKKKKELYKKSDELKKKVEKQKKKVSKLNKGKEPVHDDKFDQKKAQEESRMNKLLDQLSKVRQKLEPDKVEEDYLRQVSQGGDIDDDDADDGDDDVQVEDLENVDDEGEGEGEDDDDDDDEGDDDDEDSEVSDLGDTVESGEIITTAGKGDKSSDKQKKRSRFSRSRSPEKEAQKKAKEESKLEKKREKEEAKKAKEQEKKEKKEREKREKEEKERLKKEQKEKKEKEKGKGKSRSRSKSKDKGKSKKEEVEDIEDESDEEEEEEEGEESGEEAEESKAVAKKDKSKKTEKSKDFSRERSSRWSLFRRKSDSKAKSGKDVAAEQNDDDEEEEEDSEEDEGEEEEDEEEEGEEEEDEYEDEEEEEEESEEEQDTPVKAKSKKTVAPQEESDEYEDDEEEEEEEEEGEEEEEEDSEESEDEFERPAEISSDDDADFLDEGMKQFEAVCDFVAEQNEDLGFKVGDNLTILDTREDGWWVAEDEEGRRGLVPSTYLKLKKDYSDHRDLQSPEQPQSPDPETPRSGKMLWKGLKAAVTETSVTDVLTAMGAIPAGFRPSTTAKYVNDPKHTTGYYLLPKLSKSKMWFSDLHWQPKENQVRSRAVRVQRMISLWGVRNMSKIGVGLEILSRHVRICMFDGDKVLSNVHTVRATTTGPDGKEWRFSPKVTGILPSLMDGECFVRSNHTQQKLGILFELCLSYIRSKTGERGEFSCGWHHLPLFDEETGGPIFSKNYELTVHGGTPYEQDVEVDPSISRKASTSKIRAMMSANKQPRLVVKILAPTKDQKQLLDQLPDTIVSSTGYLTFLSYFRKLLADVLLRDRINMETADLIHHPVLASFPEAVKYPDIMDALRSTWADKMKNVKKADKRDNEHMKDFFCQIFMETCYPLLHSPTLATPKWADAAVDNARWEEIAAFLKKNREQAGVLMQLLSPDTMHQPFDTKEVTFDLLSGYQGYR